MLIKKYMQGVCGCMIVITRYDTMNEHVLFMQKQLIMVCIRKMDQSCKLKQYK